MAVALGRAAPAIIASAATVVLGLLGLLVAELNSTKSLGPVVAVGVVARLSLCRRCWSSSAAGCSGRGDPPWARPSRPSGAAGPHRRSPGPPAAAGVGGDRGGAGRPGGGSPGWGPTAWRAGTPSAPSPSRSWPATSQPGWATRSRSSAPPRRPPSRGRRWRPPPGGDRGHPPQPSGGDVSLEDPDQRPDRQPGYASVDRLRDRVRAVAGADAKVGGASAVNLDIQRATRHDTTWSCPGLGGGAGHLGLVLGAVVAPLLLVATVVCRSRPPGVSALAFERLFGFAGPTRPSRRGRSCSWSRWAPTTTAS
jgi:putative drug exporter of the RND superfamily